jgi:uncharacterized membrane protein YcjF (UPF0283 family)
MLRCSAMQAMRRGSEMGKTMIKTMLKGFGVLCISAVLMTCVMVGIGELNAFFASQISDWMKMGVAGLMCLFVIAFVLYVLGSFVEES